MGESFECGGCLRRVQCLGGSGIAKIRGARQRVCADCKALAREARRASVAERRRVGRIINAFSEQARHEREGSGTHR